ncbi:diguanylate cyclase [Vibrio sp. RE86]|uniref:sensor domain-containing diguanylate cyclase n=1 Tax=Vibrio sp. RE86 TaxID=2607605 RepID=UPI0014937A55|nr:diguanylate cyclase [Vibrio sp. RE86]NOH80393.1 diguanylate cyclase [Vibrio sp. RE86]
MSTIAVQKIQALFAQIQLYHGIDGLLRLEESVNAICDKYQCPLPLAQKHFLAGMKHDRLDQLDEAIEQYNLCLSQCSNSDIILNLHVHIVMGSIYADREDYNEAYRIYQVVLDKVHFLDDNYLAFAYTNISDFYLCLKEYQSAYELAALGEKSGRTVGNYVNQSICLLNMGFALGHLRQHEKAVKYIEQAKSIAATLTNTRNEAIAYGYLGQVKSLANCYEKSEVIANFEQAETLFKKVFDAHNQTENLICFAAYLEQQNDDARAFEICHQLKDKVDASSNYGFFETFYKTQIKLAEKRQDHRSLLQLQREYIAAGENALNRAQHRECVGILNSVAQINTEQDRLLLARMEEQIGLITEVGQYIATNENIKENLPFIYNKVGSIFPSEEFGIALYDEVSQILSYDYFYDQDGFVESTSIDCSKEHSVGSYVVKNKETVHLNRIVEESFDVMVPKQYRETSDKVQYKSKEKPVQSIMLTPIMLGNKVLGVLSVQHALPDQYQQVHRNLFEKLASFIAIALENYVQRQELRQANMMLDELSKTDPLTKLYNRYQLDKIGPKLAKVAAQEKHHLAVIMIDIDYYKGFNDFHGHQMGDHALTEVSAQMKKAFSSQGDYLFRYGGDEFMVLCYNQSTHSIEQKLSSLQESVKGLGLSNPLSECSQFLTLSMGAANYTQMESHYMSFDLLCNLADKELYKAKKLGKNTFSMVSRTAEFT